MDLLIAWLLDNIVWGSGIENADDDNIVWGS